MVTLASSHVTEIDHPALADRQLELGPRETADPRDASATEKACARVSSAVGTPRSRHRNSTIIRRPRWLGKHAGIQMASARDRRRHYSVSVGSHAVMVRVGSAKLPGSGGVERFYIEPVDLLSVSSEDVLLWAPSGKDPFFGTYDGQSARNLSGERAVETSTAYRLVAIFRSHRNGLRDSRTAPKGFVIDDFRPDGRKQVGFLSLPWIQDVSHEEPYAAEIKRLRESEDIDLAFFRAEGMQVDCWPKGTVVGVNLRQPRCWRPKTLSFYAPKEDTPYLAYYDERDRTHSASLPEGTRNQCIDHNTYRLQVVALRVEGEGESSAYHLDPCGLLATEALQEKIWGLPIDHELGGATPTPDLDQGCLLPIPAFEEGRYRLPSICFKGAEYPLWIEASVWENAASDTSEANRYAVSSLVWRLWARATKSVTTARSFVRGRAFSEPYQIRSDGSVVSLYLRSCLIPNKVDDGYEVYIEGRSLDEDGEIALGLSRTGNAFQTCDFTLKGGRSTWITYSIAMAADLVVTFHEYGMRYPNSRLTFNLEVTNPESLSTGSVVLGYHCIPSEMWIAHVAEGDGDPLTRLISCRRPFVKASVGHSPQYYKVVGITMKELGDGPGLSGAFRTIADRKGILFKDGAITFPPIEGDESA